MNDWGELSYNVTVDALGQKKLEAKISLLDDKYQLMTPDGTRVIHQGLLKNITCIYANGADGKPGVDGTNGCKGKPGSRGADAYLNYYQQPIAGTDGYPGGRGGDATPGTDGEDGKDGGNIVIYYDEFDSDLLDALKLFVAGGKGGKAGKHGVAGEGGEGGPGGRSFQYTELVERIHYDTYPCHDDFSFDRHHHHPMHYHVAPHLTYDYETRTIPGGHPGAKGSSGYQPSYELYNGKNGLNGRISYSSNGKTHLQCYQFKFESVTLNGYTIDTIPRRGQTQRKFEYGDIIDVTAVISNPARNQNLPHTMPTPASNQVFIARSHMINQLQSSQVDVIAANTRASTAESSPIRFQILPGLSTSDNQYFLNFAVYNPRLGRPYQGAYQNYAVTVGYPVSLGKTSPTMSVISGEKLELSATVLRDSAFHKMNDDMRQAKVKLWKNGTLDREILVGTETVNPISVDLAVPFQETNANVYNQNLAVSLDWPVLNGASGEWREINRQSINVLVTPKYQPDGSGYVVVVNDRTSTDQINSLISNLKSLTKSESIAIYNISTPVKELSINQVIQDHRFGSVLMFNNYFVVDNAFLTSAQLLDSSIEDLAAENGVSIALTSEGSSHQKGRVLPGSCNTFSSAHGLLIQLFSDTLKNRDVYTLNTQHPIELFELERKLKEYFPTRSYYVIKNARNSFLIQQVPKSPTHRLQVGFSDASGTVNLSAIVKVASLTQKLKDILKHPTLTDAYHQLYLKAIMDDLQEEQALLATSHSYFTLKKTYRHDFTKELTKLNQLLEHVNTMKEGALCLFTPILIKILAEIQYQAEKQTSFWTWLASFFVVQNDEALVKSTALLSTAILKKAKTVDSNAEAKVALQKNLKHYIAKRNNHFFFRPGEDSDFNGAENLLKACETSIQPARNESKRLKAFQDEYDKCYTVRL